MRIWVPHNHQVKYINTPVDLLKVEQLNIDNQYFNKQGKLQLLMNIANEFNEEEISRIINVVREIKRMMK